MHFLHTPTPPGNASLKRIRAEKAPSTRRKHGHALGPVFGQSLRGSNGALARQRIAARSQVQCASTHPARSPRTRSPMGEEWPRLRLVFDERI
jgi:hypothetical protein